MAEGLRKRARAPKRGLSVRRGSQSKHSRLSQPLGLRGLSVNGESQGKTQQAITTVRIDQEAGRESVTPDAMCREVKGL